MPGGVVWEILVLEEKVWINCFKEDDLNKEVSIEVKHSFAAECIETGDYLWWQQKNVYWTPVSKSFREYRLERVGVQGVPRPHPAEVVKEYA